MNNIYLNIDFELFEKQRLSLDKAMMRMCQNDWPEYEDLVCLRSILDAVHSQLRAQNRVKRLTLVEDLERHEICGIPLIRYGGGIQRFDHLTLDNLKLLAEKTYIKLNDTQNDSPSVREFLEFARSHPTIKFEFRGYIVSPERDDCRISIEGFRAWTNCDKDNKEVMTFAAFADELEEIEPYLIDAWWD